MNKIIAGLIWWLSCIPGIVTAQSAQDAWVYLHDKPDSTYYLSHPLEMLSQRALDRRQRYGISLDEKDVPVYRPYLDSLRHSSGIQMRAYSKWLNAVHVQGTRPALEALASITFVDSVVFADRSIPTAAKTTNIPDKWYQTGLGRPAGYDYGDDTTAFALHNAKILHDQGYTGSGVLIAVIDAGFPNADTSRAMQHIYVRNGVIDTYNFPDDTPDVYTRHWHGTIVWSVIGGLIDGEFVGTAPGADYCLYISEDVSQEMPIEESWWAMAAERADSVGVDVINTSLGYTTFDNASYNHTHDELGRGKAFISRAASIAVQKGMHVVIAAGNSGNSGWQKIGFPADSPEVIAVGAISADSTRASFSSTGPDAEGRIKPDIMSWGVQVKSYYRGHYYNVSGTSLAAPVITGLTADMVQAFPLLNPGSLKQKLLESSDRYDHPDNLYGYGIPNYGLLFEKLTEQAGNLNNIVVYPNPFTQKIYLKNNLIPLQFLAYNLQGRLLFQGKALHEIDLGDLPVGIYWIGLGQKGQFVWFKLIKQNP